MSTTAVKMATLSELKTFANRVRKAGGGNPLDALMPAVPEDSEQCLIAKNLNFNCNVNSVDVVLNGDTVNRWCMSLHDEELANQIGEAVNCPVVADRDSEWAYPNGRPGYVYTDVYRIVLPLEIGAVADQFDTTYEVLREVNASLEDFINNEEADTGKVPSKAKQREYLKSAFDAGQFKDIRTFWPYIEESYREIDEIGIFNEKGQLIL